MFRLRRTKLSVVLITVLVLQLIFAVSLPQAGAVDTTVAMKSSQTSVTVGDTFAVDITIANVTDLYGASLDIKFDPAMVEVVPAADNKAVAAGDAFSASTAELTDTVNSYDNISGEIHLARHLLGSTGGVTIGATNKTIGTITFKAKAQGTFSLQFDPAPYTGKTAPAAGYNVLCKLSNSMIQTISYSSLNTQININNVTLPSISVTPAKGAPGTKVAVPIILSNITGLGIGGGQFAINYDPTVAIVESITDVVPGTAFNASTFSINIDNASTGKVIVGFMGTTNVTGNATLCTVNFKLLGSMGAKTTLTLTESEFNDGENIVELLFLSGSLEVGVKYGDVNNDGKVSAIDATYTLRAAVGLRTLDAQQVIAADVNGDGKVSAIDATYILRFAVGLRNNFPVEIP
jgi:uncharacterized protein GlcG (DUF336 family)